MKQAMNKADQADPETRELIAFRVGKQEFCINVMTVREIRGWTAATALPRAPRYIRGVINLRGAVLPRELRMHGHALAPRCRSGLCAPRGSVR